MHFLSLLKACYFPMRDRKVVDLEGVEGGEGLEYIEGGEIVIKIYYMKRIYLINFLKVKKLEKKIECSFSRRINN